MSGRMSPLGRTEKPSRRRFPPLAWPVLIAVLTGTALYPAQHGLAVLFRVPLVRSDLWGSDLTPFSDDMAKVAVWVIGLAAAAAVIGTLAIIWRQGMSMMKKAVFSVIALLVGVPLAYGATIALTMISFVVTILIVP